jgi:hypothetical protein
MERCFLFGRPVLQAKPIANGPRRVFVLGAYPSALHVRWFSPQNDCLIQAVAVDNEPEPFWNGKDEHERIEDWRRQVKFRDNWGRVEPCGKLNGSSGDWVETQVLGALGIGREEAWITDCLDTYFESKAAAQRLDSESIVSLLGKLGIQARSHEPHPSESKIVQLSVASHQRRLLAEVATARPECVVTLGNAALRVFANLVGSHSPSINKLSVNGYGMPVIAQIDGRGFEWIPLAHPAAPLVYQDAHTLWVKSRQRSV